MSLKKDIKSLLLQEDITMTLLAEKLTKKAGKNITIDGISRKLTKGTMKYNEVKQIADILGYDIKFEKRN